MALSFSVCVSQIEHLQAKLEETRLNETQLKHTLLLKTEALSSNMEELIAAAHTVSSEMMELQVERMELESVKVS